MILWGPPGSGKTTLARLMAEAFDAEFIALSAVFSGVKDIREAVAAAQATPRAVRPAHDPLRRRGASLQQGAAGRVPAVRRAGPDHLRRRDHREPVVRGEQRAAFARHGLCARACAPSDLATLLDAARAGLPTCDEAARARAHRLCRRRCAAAAQRRRDHLAEQPRRAPAAVDGAFVEQTLAQEPAPLRQGRRAVLRPDLGAAQVGARLATPMRRCTGSCACSTAAPIRSTSAGAWCAWRSRTSASPTRARCAWRSMPCETYERLGSPKASSRSRGGGLPRAARRNRMRSTRPIMRRAHFVAQGRHAAGAAAHAQCADAAHEGARLRQRAIATRTTKRTRTRRARATCPKACRRCEWYRADGARPGGEDPREARIAELRRRDAEARKKRMIDIQLLRKNPRRQSRRTRLATRGPGTFDAEQFQRFETAAQEPADRVEQERRPRATRSPRISARRRPRARTLRALMAARREAEVAARASPSSSWSRLQAGFQDFLARIPEHAARVGAGRQLAEQQPSRSAAGASRASSISRRRTTSTSAQRARRPRLRHRRQDRRRRFVGDARRARAPASRARAVHARRAHARARLHRDLRALHGDARACADRVELAKFEDDLFKIEAATTTAVPHPDRRVPVTNFVRDEIVPLEQLPLKFVCHSPCFRSEAGSAARTRAA